MSNEVVEDRAHSSISRARFGFLRRLAVGWRPFLSHLDRAGRWAWLFTFAVALIYTASFSRFIDRHTSLPFWDGCVYVQKALNLAEQFHRASFSERLNPALYFEGVQPQRSPLLLAIVAILLGPDARIESIARVWLAVRVAVILLALFLLSREFGTTRFVPAAALVIFSSPLMCNFYRLYMMDEPFGAFGLLAFTLILIDDRHQRMSSALAASAGILALFLVKPVAPAFVFPFCLIRGIRALLPLRHGWPEFRQQALRLLPWAVPYLVLLATMFAVFYATPYGSGVRAQYKLGLAGFWQKDLSASTACQLAALMLPPWLLIASVLTLVFFRSSQSKIVFLYVGSGIAWWLPFCFFLTYAIEDRLIGQAMPYAVAGTLLWLCQRQAIAAGLTAAASLFFLCNTLAANGGIQYHSLPKVAHFLSPAPEHQQPVPEVGLLPFASQLGTTIKAEKATTVCALLGDHYVTANALNMALRMSTQPQILFAEGLPRSPARFDLDRLCQIRWFVTKTRRPHSGEANPRLWLTLNWMHALITDPQSPLHPYFRKLVEGPIRQPDLQDTLVLWHLPSPPPDAIIADALRWLQQSFPNHPAPGRN